MLSERIGVFRIPEMEVRLYAMAGAVSFTVMFKVNVPIPPGPVAVTVYVAAKAVVVGVPEMMPVPASMERPDGSAGRTL